ncbi:MAG: AAA family ATPase, partial [Magnetococcales bacterium]|nr:AAA family ATPase [Magnetococcales bacterium]
VGVGGGGGGGGRVFGGGGGGGGVGLLEGGGGLVGVRGVLDGLEAEAAGLYRFRGKIQEINRGLGAFKEAKDRGREVALSQRQWQELDGERRSREAALEALQSSLEQQQKERRRWVRIHRNLPRLAEQAALSTALGELAGIPELPPDGPQRRRQSVEALRRAELSLERSSQEIELLEKELGEIHLPDLLLAREGEIEALFQEGGQIVKSLADLPRRQGELKGVADRIGQLLTEAGLEPDPDGARAKLPPRPLQAEVRELINAHGRLESRLEEAGSALAELIRERQGVARELVDFEKIPDPAPLQATLGEVLESGGLEREIREEQRKLAGLTDQLQGELASLEHVSDQIGSWIKNPIPSVEVVERFEVEMRTHDEAVKQVERDIREAQRGVDEGLAEIEGLEAAGEVPTEEVVQAARHHRDQGWALLKRGFVEGQEDISKEAAEYGGDLPLSEAFEGNMAKADGLADGRFQEAARVARFRALQIEVARGEKGLAELLTKRQALEITEGRLTERWHGAWQGSDLIPDAPQRMLGWLRRREGVVRLWLESNALQRQLQDRLALAGHWKTRLGEQLVAMGEVVPQGGVGELVRFARGVAEGLEKRRAEGRHLQERLKNLIKKESLSQDRLEGGRREMAGWTRRWQQAMMALEQDVSAPPSRIVTYLEVLGEVGREFVNWDNLKGRINGMACDVEAFESRVRPLVAAVAADLMESPAVEGVGILRQRLQEGDRLRQRRVGLEKNLAKHQSQAREAQGDLRQAQGVLAELCRLYGCSEAGELEGVEALYARKKELATSLAALEKGLLKEGEGLTLQEMAEEAASVDRDRLPGQLEALEEEIGVLGEKQAVLSRRLGEIQVELDGMTGGNGAAAQAAQEKQEALAGIKRGAERYLELKLASGLIKKAVTRFRERNQSPVLKKAGEMFRQLTCDHFSGLEMDLDSSDNPIFLAKRREGGRIGVEEMSDGTRDQLHLAFRLALLEIREEEQEPLPLVLDDILIHFDDQRAGATLRLLSQRKSPTQTLFFTHHPHLIEIARKEVGEGGMAVVEL